MKLKKVFGSSNRNITTIQWNLGLRCNYDCSFCGYNTHDLKSNHLSFEIMVNLLNKIKETYKDRESVDLIITGGEPTLNPNFLNLLKYIKEEIHIIKDICINTNGSASVKKYIEISKLVKTIVFSWQIEHINPNHLKKVLMSLKKCNVNFHVNVPVLPGLLDQIKENAKWLKDNNIKFIFRKIHPMYKDNSYNMPFESGFNANISKPKNLKSNYYSDKELDFLNNINKMNHKNNIILQTEDNKEIFTNVNMLFSKNLNSFVNWKCNAGLETLYIHNDENIYRGNCMFGGSLGNIKNKFTLSSEPIICGKEKCNCAADLFTTKWKEI